MDAQILQFSIIVTGGNNNPTVLNPDFLRHNQIVLNEWGWEVVQSISTPPFSQVEYNSGVSVTVNTTKIELVDNSVSPTMDETHIIEIAKKYVSVLQHVPYSAIGINFTAAIPTENPSKYLKERFIRNGLWDTKDYPINDVGLRFVYPLPKGKITFSIDPGVILSSSGGGDESEKKTIKSIVINANFHRNCTNNYPDIVGEILNHIDCATQDFDQFNTLLQQVVLSKQS